jgi:hypothetical protein
MTTYRQIFFSQQFLISRNGSYSLAELTNIMVALFRMSCVGHKVIAPFQIVIGVLVKYKLEYDVIQKRRKYFTNFARLCINGDFFLYWK